MQKRHLERLKEERMEKMLLKNLYSTSSCTGSTGGILISQLEWTSFCLLLTPWTQKLLDAPSNPGLGAMISTSSLYLLMPWSHSRAGSPTAKVMGLALDLRPWALSLDSASLSRGWGPGQAGWGGHS